VTSEFAPSCGNDLAGDGRKILPSYLNDLEHDRRYPPENAVFVAAGQAFEDFPDILYFCAKRVRGDLVGGSDDRRIEAACRAFRTVLNRRAEQPT
jgi:hypothetical protein